jgi:hypothetical protein
MSSGIPLSSNFSNLSCQLGGFTLNGNINSQTAQSATIITINDPAVILNPSINSPTPVGYLRVSIGIKNDNSGPEYYYIPLYQ